MSQLYFVILAKAGIQEGLRRFGSGFLLPCLPAGRRRNDKETGIETQVDLASTRVWNPSP